MLEKHVRAAEMSTGSSTPGGPRSRLQDQQRRQDRAARSAVSEAHLSRTGSYQR